MRVGIVGGGQLARMLALAGYPLGLDFVFLDPKADACAGQVGRLIQGDYDDRKALGQLASECDVATYDFENVPQEAARWLEDHVPVFPPAVALQTAQDRLEEKTLFTRLGIPTPQFQTVDSREQLTGAAEALGYPCVLKTRRLGYDGKGQRLLKSADDLEEAWEALGGSALILEQFVEFKREASVIAVRGADGEVRCYPLVENRHRNGILATSFAPASPGQAQELGQRYIGQLLDHFGYVGVLCLELFDLGDRVLANEIAPRVHNSGHWTIDGAETSQFENHLRAILGWPLGATDANGCSAMINWIGAMPEPAQALSCDNVHWHDYGKAAREGRKVGHVTLRADDLMRLQALVGRFALVLGKQFAAASGLGGDDAGT